MPGLPVAAAVMRPFASTVILALVNEPTFPFTVCRVRTPGLDSRAPRDKGTPAARLDPFPTKMFAEVRIGESLLLKVVQSAANRKPSTRLVACGMESVRSVVRFPPPWRGAVVLICRVTGTCVGSTLLSTIWVHWGDPPPKA